ncbi:unnamed protein product [Caenorhabditis angaria]|uniref:RING-type domain-containing protein n=1 Tax=Caenorhabditis angaria TaxID=860376 RepID=A0A9P1MUM4_9PELO|nr:unnamed protein product [Caenorhabditis angaria]
MPSTSCLICTEDYNDHENCPKVTRCGHTFCISCLLKIKKTVGNEETYECFTCKQQFAFHEMTTNFAIMPDDTPKPNVAQNLEESHFACCNCPRNATKHCKNCGTNYCGSCEVITHSMYPNHITKLIGQSTHVEKLCSCLQNGISLFCSNMECSKIELKATCSSCFAKHHANCSSIFFSAANKMLKSQIEVILDKKFKEFDENDIVKEKFNQDLIRKHNEQRKKIETNYQKLREELERNYKISMRQLDHFIELHRSDKTNLIDEEKRDISNKINVIDKIRDLHSEDLVSIYPKLFELFQSKPVDDSYIKDPKVQPNGLKWFPSHNILVTGNWQNGKIYFLDLLKKQSFGVCNVQGKCEMYYGSTQLFFHFSADSSIQNKCELHFTQFQNANPRDNCTVITITDKENQEGAFYLPLDPTQKPKAQQTIHQIIRDNFF